MRSFAWFTGLIALGLLSIAAFAYPAWLLLSPHFSFPFHRIGERIGMLVLLVGFFPVASRLRLADRTSLGYGVARRSFVREMSVGVAAGVVSMALVAALMNVLGLLDWTPSASLTAAALTKLVLLRLTSGLAVAFIEETFLRGAMLTAIARESGARAAVLLTSIVYAATHFFASYKIPAAEVNAWSGIALLSGTLHQFAHPFDIADAFLCLTAVGIVLGVIRVTTGNIAACIGLHAGWVWVMLVVHDMSRPLRAAPLGFLLSASDGFIGWLVLACTIPLGIGLRRYYARGASSSSR